MFSLGREPQVRGDQLTNEPRKGRQIFSPGREPQVPEGATDSWSGGETRGPVSETRSQLVNLLTRCDAPLE